MRNLITDVPGVLVGNAQDDARAATGVTVAVFEQGTAASVVTECKRLAIMVNDDLSKALRGALNELASVPDSCGAARGPARARLRAPLA